MAIGVLNLYFFVRFSTPIAILDKTEYDIYKSFLLLERTTETIVGAYHRDAPLKQPLLRFLMSRIKELKNG